MAVFELVVGFMGEKVSLLYQLLSVSTFLIIKTNIYIALEISIHIFIIITQNVLLLLKVSQKSYKYITFKMSVMS